jgi:hypothetical protein
VCSDIVESDLDFFVAGVAVSDAHIGRDDADLWVGILGHRCGPSDHVVSICEDGKVGAADIARVAGCIISGGWPAAGTCEQREQETKLDSGLSFKRFLEFLETDRLRSAARSKRGRHVENVVLASEIVDVDIFTALIDQRDVLHHVAMAGTGGGDVAGIIASPAALVAKVIDVDGV